MNLPEKRTALVTGSMQNLGLTIACTLARNHIRVIIHGPDQRTAETARESLSAELPDAELEAIGFDLGNPREIEAAFSGMATRGITPDILINNAAHLGLGASGFLEQSPTFFRDVLEVNFFGTFRCSQLAAKAMAARGGGDIVMISSLAGTRPIWGRSAYNAGKAALEGLARSMALELGALGIRVNSIVPGYVRTPRWEQLDEGVEERRRKNIPVGHPTDQEEIAQTVLFLVSGATPTLTGACIAIDGGLGAQQVPRDTAC